MNTKLKLLIYLSACVPFCSFAQDEIPEQPWEQRDRSNATPLDYVYVREADVMWSKKIWRTIDIREKINLPFGNPQKPLIQLLHEAAIAGTIKAYDPTVENADQLNKIMPPTEVAMLGVEDDTVEVVDPVSLDTKVQYIHNPLTWDKIIKYKVKEVWFFDTKTSTMQVRIIAIAPIMADLDASGYYRGDRTMYWLYYPDLRNMLAKEEAFNPNNDTKSPSWDDIFVSRRFQSYIYKESNVYDRAIKEYATGVDAQLESDRIKQQMFEYEHDLWDY